MSVYQAGGIAITGALSGTETVVVGNGGPQITTATTQQIANLGSTGKNTANTNVNTVGAATLTAAAISGRLITRGGVQTADFSDTTDTAAAIIAALPGGGIVGESFSLDIENNTSFAETILAGSGVTVSVISVIPALMMARFLMTYSAAGAVTMVGIQLVSINGTITNAIQNGNVQVTGSLTATSNTVLASITGMSVTLTTGASYNIRGWLHGTAGASGGIKVALSGTAALTSLTVTGNVFVAGVSTSLGVLTGTALGSSLAAVTAAFTDIYVDGVCVVNTGGTLTVQAAQNATNGSNTIVNAGYLEVFRVS